MASPLVRPETRAPTAVPTQRSLRAAPVACAGFPVLAGAPPEGIVCALPSSWTSRSRTLIFKLKLSKSGATESEVPIHQILHRSRPSHNSWARARPH